MKLYCVYFPKGLMRLFYIRVSYITDLSDEPTCLHGFEYIPFKIKYGFIK